MFAWREDLPGAHLAVTDRHGGVSHGPWGSLDLAGHVGDDPEAVAQNRRRLARAIGLSPDRLIFMAQVHGAEVMVVDRPWDGEPPEADGLVTATPGLALVVLVADCTPVLLADLRAGVIGVAHAGRSGLALGVVPAVLDAMAGLGAQQVRAWVGPSICGPCYEVPEPMRAEVTATVPQAWAVTASGTAALDIAAGVRAQLAGRVEQLTQLPGCSREDDSLFSYRRDRVTGRFAGLVWRSG